MQGQRNHKTHRKVFDPIGKFERMKLATFWRIIIIAELIYESRGVIGVVNF